MTFYLKGCDKSYVDLSLDINNSLSEFFRPMIILGFIVSFNY
jgi:hypothetical protein